MGYKLSKTFTWNETVWNPSMIPDLALWLDAADASTITTVSGGVSEWRDKSGSRRSVSQSSSTSRPSVNSNGIGGLPSIEFDGADDFLINTSIGLPVGASARSAVIVYRPLRTTGINALFAQGTTNTQGAWFALQARQGTSDPYFAGYSADVSSAGQVTLDPKIALVSYDGNTVTIRRNGSSFNSATRSLNTTGNTFWVGASNELERANTLIAEICFFNTNISQTNFQKLEGYLARKWGLLANLPANHPYKTLPPLP